MQILAREEERFEFALPPVLADVSEALEHIDGCDNVFCDITVGVVDDIKRPPRGLGPAVEEHLLALGWLPELPRSRYLQILAREQEEESFESAPPPVLPHIFVARITSMASKLTSPP